MAAYYRECCTSRLWAGSIEITIQASMTARFLIVALPAFGRAQLKYAYASKKQMDLTCCTSRLWAGSIEIGSSTRNENAEQVALPAFGRAQFECLDDDSKAIDGDLWKFW